MKKYSDSECITVISECKELEKLNIGDYIYFTDKDEPFKIRARDNRFIIATATINEECYYSILDLEEGICGPDDYILGRFEYEKREDCEKALIEINNGEFEISRRNRAKIEDAIIGYCIDAGEYYKTNKKEFKKSEALIKDKDKDYVAYKCSECGTINIIENGIDGRKCSNCNGYLIVMGKAIIQKGLNNG